MKPSKPQYLIQYQSIDKTIPLNHISWFPSKTTTAPWQPTITINLSSLPNSLPPIPIKLERPNFYLWKNIMIPLLESYKLLGYANGSIPPPLKDYHCLTALTDGIHTINFV